MHSSHTVRVVRTKLPEEHLAAVHIPVVRVEAVFLIKKLSTIIDDFTLSDDYSRCMVWMNEFHVWDVDPNLAVFSGMHCFITRLPFHSMSDSLMVTLADDV